MQTYPSLRGARPYPISEGGIEMPQSTEQRRAFGSLSECFSEQDVANVRRPVSNLRPAGFARYTYSHRKPPRRRLDPGWQVRGFSTPFYKGNVDEWRDKLVSDAPNEALREDMFRGGGAHGYRRNGSLICPAMHVWAKCGPTLQQMRDVMSALESCGHLLIATNLTRVGKFELKEQTFFSSAELKAMTGHIFD